MSTVYAKATRGATVYANLWKISNGQFFNASNNTYGAYSAGSWTSYKVAATEVSPGVFSITVPAAVDGTVRHCVDWYEQVGGTAATTDTQVYEGSFPDGCNVEFWRGEQPSTLYTGYVAVDVKQWLEQGVDEVLPIVQLDALAGWGGSALPTITSGGDATAENQETIISLLQAK